MKTLIILLLAAGTWGYAAAQNKPSTGQSTQVTGQADTSVAYFIRNAIKSSKKEIEAGKMAQEKAQNAAVKSFATRMIKDHTEAMELLKPIAERKNLTLASITEDGLATQIGTSQATATGTQQTIAKTGTSAEKNTSSNTNISTNTNTSSNDNVNTSESPTTKAWAEAKKKSDHSSMLESLSQKSGAEFDREYMNMMVLNHQKAVSLFQQAASSRDADVRNFATNMLPVLKDHLQSAQTILGSLK